MSLMKQNVQKDQKTKKIQNENPIFKQIIVVSKDEITKF